MWAGIDYLGEVGLGAWERRDYVPDFSHGPVWVSAGAGRLDLTGRETAEMLYMQAAWGQITVFPEDRAFRRHSPSGAPPPYQAAAVRTKALTAVVYYWFGRAAPGKCDDVTPGQRASSR